MQFEANKNKYAKYLSSYENEFIFINYLPI